MKNVPAMPRWQISIRPISQISAKLIDCRFYTCPTGWRFPQSTLVRTSKNGQIPALIMTKFMVLILLLSGLPSCLLAANPIVPDVGMADPHIHIFNGKAYLYCTHDAGGPASKKWDMPDWNIWSSPDLVRWTHERTISPKQTYIGKSDMCWAPDAATMNGKYYFYFSNHNLDAGVMVADDPAGPFHDALGRPLLPANLTPTQEYDVSVLVDNGVPYIAFGHYSPAKPELRYYIARLNTNMMSLAENPKVIQFIGKFPGDDKPDITKHGGRYYLSAGANYAIADNIYGPYRTRPIVGDDSDPYGLNGRAHGKLFDWNNQSFFVWCRFIKGKGNEFKYRESLLTYVHYKADGDIVYDREFLNDHGATGVGQYDAGWDRIEAEWFMASKDDQKTECPHGGFEISGTKDGSWVAYPNVKNLPADGRIIFNCSSANGGTIEVRTDNSTGPLLGTCAVPATQGWKDYREIRCQLKNSAGTKKVVLVFKSNPVDTVHLDWFRFEK
jgi:hypothetical protein